MSEDILLDRSYRSKAEDRACFVAWTLPSVVEVVVVVEVEAVAEVEEEQAWSVSQVVFAH